MVGVTLIRDGVPEHNHKIGNKVDACAMKI